jgi:hypothetical protein
MSRRRSSASSSMLQESERGQGCRWRDRAASTEQIARDLLERSQRRVALERLRERCGARVADLVAIQAAARRGGSGMPVAKQNRRLRQGARDLLERRQRRVALERLRERRGARLADLSEPQAAARKSVSGMLMAKQGRRQREGARDLLERRQRRIALERLRERRGARVADLVVTNAAAKLGRSGLLVAKQGRRLRAGRARLTRATSASRCS